VEKVLTDYSWAQVVEILDSAEDAERFDLDKALATVALICARSLANFACLSVFHRLKQVWGHLETVKLLSHFLIIVNLQLLTVISLIAG
jgi:hypothetical protein